VVGFLEREVLPNLEKSKVSASFNIGFELFAIPANLSLLNPFNQK
jgi:hypothetical protein